MLQMNPEKAGQAKLTETPESICYVPGRDAALHVFHPSLKVASGR
jgi:hypothetical protein